MNVNIPFETADARRARGSEGRAAGHGRAAHRRVRARPSPATWTPTFGYDGRVGSPTADASLLADGWVTLTFLPVAREAVPAGQRRLKELVESQD